MDKRSRFSPNQVVAFLVDTGYQLSNAAILKAPSFKQRYPPQHQSLKQSDFVKRGNLKPEKSL